MNKKALKLEVLSSCVVTQMKVKGSFVFVEISHMHDGTEYTAFDFAKWSTVDMKTVECATKLYEKMLEVNCGCGYCREAAKQLAHLIEKFNWSDERGLAIATGRAVGDIVMQIYNKQLEEYNIAAGHLSEKSSDGQILKVWDYETEQMTHEPPIPSEEDAFQKGIAVGREEMKFSSIRKINKL